MSLYATQVLSGSLREGTYGRLADRFGAAAAPWRLGREAISQLDGLKPAVAADADADGERLTASERHIYAGESFHGRVVPNRRASAAGGMAGPEGDGKAGDPAAQVPDSHFRE